MKLPNKDQILLEQSYEQVREAHGPISGEGSRPSHAIRKRTLNK